MIIIMMGEQSFCQQKCRYIFFLSILQKCEEKKTLSAVPMSMSRVSNEKRADEN